MCALEWLISNIQGHLIDYMPTLGSTHSWSKMVVAVFILWISGEKAFKPYEKRSRQSC